MIMSMGAMAFLLGACALPPKSAGENDPEGGKGGATATGSGGPADSATSVGLPGVSVTSGGSLGDSMTSAGASSTAGGGSDPGITCRDALYCVVGCVAEFEATNAAEPDLTCILECEESLTVEESLHLFELTECVSTKCIELGVCEVLEPTGTVGEPSTGSGTGSGSGGSGSSGVVPPTQCLDCILANIFDEQPGGDCQSYADACV